MCGSFVEVEVDIGWVFFLEGLVRGDGAGALGSRCHGVQTMLFIDGNLGGRDVCFGDSRRTCRGDKQGDQQDTTPYHCGEPVGRGRRHRCSPVGSTG